jgi:hypothetical protein
VERDRKRKIQMEEQRASSGMGKASLGTTDSGMISIKGTAAKKEESYAQEQARKTLESMAAGHTRITSSGSVQSGGPASTMKSASSGAGPSAAEAAAALAALADMAKKATTGAENLNNFFDAQNSNNSPDAKNATSLNAVNMSSPSSVQTTTPGAGVSNDEVEAAVRGLAEDAKKKEAKAKEASAGVAGKEVNAKSSKSGLAGGIKGLLKKARTLFSRTNEKKGYTESTGIVMGTQKAIDEIASETPDANILPLKNTTQAICFFVMSKSHQGFVLCSIAHNTEPLMEFVDMFKTRLTELMADFDKNFLTSGALEVTMQQVDFDEWVTSQAAFSKKFVHLDRECGVAFFELSPAKPDVTPSTKKDFVQMKLMDVTQDRKLGFNVFLYLPVNKKFILYTRRGGKFAEAQKKRLISRGVSGVHLHENEVEQMHRTHLEAYIDEMISEHYETRDKKEDASS